MQSIIAPFMPLSTSYLRSLATLRVYFTFGSPNRPLFSPRFLCEKIKISHGTWFWSDLKAELAGARLGDAPAHRTSQPGGVSVPQTSPLGEASERRTSHELRRTRPGAASARRASARRRLERRMLVASPGPQHQARQLRRDGFRGNGGRGERARRLRRGERRRKRLRRRDSLRGKERQGSGVPLHADSAPSVLRPPLPRAGPPQHLSVNRLLSTESGPVCVCVRGWVWAVCKATRRTNPVVYTLAWCENTFGCNMCVCASGVTCEVTTRIGEKRKKKGRKKEKKKTPRLGV